jgi:hypothetical protein
MFALDKPFVLRESCDDDLQGVPTAIVETSLPCLRFHDLRLARIVGHTSVTTTRTIYAHAMESRPRRGPPR